MSLIYGFKYYSLGKRQTTRDSFGGTSTNWRYCIVKPALDSFDAWPLIQDENEDKSLPATLQGFFPPPLLQTSSSR